MKVVIDIDDTTFETIKNSAFFIKGGRGNGRTIEYNALNAIYYGIPLDEYCEVQPEPFINKPCVSEQVCHEDKIKILDKIRDEIENDWQLKKYPSSPFSCGLRRALEIIDKYKAESEG